MAKFAASKRVAPWWYSLVLQVGQRMLRLLPAACNCGGTVVFALKDCCDICFCADLFCVSHAGLQALGYEPPAMPLGGVLDGSKRLLASLQYTSRQGPTDDEDGGAPRGTRPAVYLGHFPGKPEDRVVNKASSHEALLDHEVGAPWGLAVGHGGTGSKPTAC